jgi:hypothetical protein
MRFLCLISLFFLISWKADEHDYNEEKYLKSEQMKIKAIKLQEVLGEDAGMATNCWSKDSKQQKDIEEYGYDYPYAENLDL